MDENKGRALGWDEEIKDGENEFSLIPAGKYPFTVLGYTRGQFNGSAKMAPCAKAIVKIRIDGPDGALGELEHNLFLNEKCFGLLAAFFRSIGLKKHGENVPMRWNEIGGRQGLCEVTVRKYPKNDGSEGLTNDIKFLDPPAAADRTSFSPNANQGGSGW